MTTPDATVINVSEYYQLSTNLSQPATGDLNGRRVQIQQQNKRIMKAAASGIAATMFLVLVIGLMPGISHGDWKSSAIICGSDFGLILVISAIGYCLLKIRER